ncbi:hypothetical protein [Streptomyces sp. NPDC001222]
MPGRGSPIRPGPLIAELHEVYGLRAPGTARQRAALDLAEWTEGGAA